VAVEGSVKIKGLRELQGAFRTVDRGLPKELREHFMDIATKVASVAASKVPRRTGAAAGSIKPRATQKSASVAFSDSDGKVPYYPWLEFGGRVGRQASIKRPFNREGNYVYPTIASQSDEIGRQAEAALEVVAEQARFTVRG
jgi:hypothetical protein